MQWLSRREVLQKFSERFASIRTHLKIGFAYRKTALKKLELATSAPILLM